MRSPKRARLPYDQRPQSNTWAAYQCYGDPDWVFRRRAPDADSVTAPPVDDWSNIVSVPSLKLALERIIVETRFQGKDQVEQRNRLQTLEHKFQSLWGRTDSVAELFGQAFVEVEHSENAVVISAPWQRQMDLHR